MPPWRLLRSRQKSVGLREATLNSTITCQDHYRAYAANALHISNPRLPGQNLHVTPTQQWQCFIIPLTKRFFMYGF
jgi:hypothetical protein